MQILIVDDDPLVRWAIRRLLPRFVIEEAATAGHALELVAERTIDAIVLDACLDRQTAHSGLRLARLLREQAWTGAMIVVSGFGGRGIERDALAAGADIFLDKVQLNRAMLRSAIEQVMSTRGSRDGDDKRRLSRLQDALQNVLDSAADEERTHGEKAYYLALFAKEGLASANDGMSVETCARLLGTTGETLRKYAIVASRWDASQLWKLLVERRGTNGNSISASHLYELARLPLAAREPWIERILTDSLSVRALQNALRSTSPEG